jgi:hypothetical protein
MPDEKRDASANRAPPSAASKFSRRDCTSTGITKVCICQLVFFTKSTSTLT